MTGTGGAPGSTAAVIVAAGRGIRSGRGVRKQFRELDGVPVVERTCAAFRGAEGIELLVLVLPADVVEDPPDSLVDGADRLVAGGESRQASVERGVEAVPDEFEILLVHDGVRPFVTRELIGRVRRAARAGPVVPVLPVVETVKEVDASGHVVRTIPRERLRRVQTPQGFPAPLLREAHRRARREGTRGTDDASLCEAAGAEVDTVRGEAVNLKLTTSEDFAYARWILARREEQRA